MLARSLALVAFALVWGCSGPAGPPDTAGDGGGMPGPDAGAAPDGDLADGPTTTHQAEVYVLDGIGGGVEGSANFYDGPGITYFDVGDHPDIYGCDRTRAGACVFHDNKKCLGPPSGSGRSAGSITIGDPGGGSLVLDPSAPPVDYPAQSSTMLSWQAGDAVSVSASGADVPPFDESVAFPDTTTVSTPTATTPVSRAADLPVAWTPFARGTVHLVITDQTAAAVVCSFPGGDGSGSVPAKVLAPLAAGMGAIKINTRDEASVITGDWTVTLVAQRYLNIGGGNTTIQ